MLANYLQQTTSADDISDAFFLGVLRVKFNLANSGCIAFRSVFSVIDASLIGRQTYSQINSQPAFIPGTVSAPPSKRHPF